MYILKQNIIKMNDNNNIDNNNINNDDDDEWIIVKKNFDKINWKIVVEQLIIQYKNDIKKITNDLINLIKNNSIADKIDIENILNKILFINKINDNDNDKYDNYMIELIKF
jgi:hypothetical protein